jgi:hypothetical protein
VICLHGLMPGAETRIFDAGHFALETRAPKTGAAIGDVFAPDLNQLISNNRPQPKGMTP